MKVACCLFLTKKLACKFTIAFIVHFTIEIKKKFMFKLVTSSLNIIKAIFVFELIANPLANYGIGKPISFDKIVNSGRSHTPS